MESYRCRHCKRCQKKYNIHCRKRYPSSADHKKASTGDKGRTSIRGGRAVRNDNPTNRIVCLSFKTNLISPKHLNTWNLSGIFCRKTLFWINTFDLFRICRQSFPHALSVGIIFSKLPCETTVAKFLICRDALGFSQYFFFASKETTRILSPPGRNPLFQHR